MGAEAAPVASAAIPASRELKLAIVLLEGRDPRLRRSQLAFQLSIPGPRLFPFSGIFGACGSECSDDRR
jgi:hypothetical protein